VVVLLWQGLLVVDWLLRGVVVVLVNLLVDGSRFTLVLLSYNRLVLDSRCDGLVHTGVVLAILRAVTR